MNTEAIKKQVSESTWLHYFNNTLFQQGHITESERNKLALKIDSRKPSANSKK